MNLRDKFLARLVRTACAVFALGALGTSAHAAANQAALHDHMELDAALVAPYRSESLSEARTFMVQLAYPSDAPSQQVQWKVQLISPAGNLVRQWVGTATLVGGKADVPIHWAGRVGVDAALPDGIYRVSLSAFSAPLVQSDPTRNISIERLIDATDSDIDLIEQVWDIRVGSTPAPEMPQFTALPVNGRASQVESFAAATASLPYTVFYGNLHSQTNHSDGGGDVSTCKDAQPPQGGVFGPADAYPYAKTAGLDFLMTSEHNHLFDGSTGTNASANPTTVHNLYQSGLGIASSYNTANPGFLAIYGMEWGVISNGGHMNIFNSPELLGWEFNSSSQLLADTNTAKSDYAAIYATMKAKGYIGQFNHPDTAGQFVIGGTALAYSADGDAVMVLAEVLNSSAFSSNTTETETSRTSFEGAFKILLERGYHIAPSSDQDNHCANWGRSYTNRTAVLLPTGTTLNSANFIAALKARRVFATMDKNSQLILTANSHIMGERFSNTGSLTLTANFANSAGRTVSTVAIMEGVPGRNGTATTLASASTITTTPANGAHYYFAKVTQDDGKILWSAPVWVDQTTATDTTPPTVSATETGSVGAITFAATASDNVGVVRVDFLVDGVVKGSLTAAPYSMSFDSTTLSNGTHSLTAKAYDADNNVGTSTAVSFTVSNPVSDTTPPTVSAASSGTSGTINFTATASDNVGVVRVDFLVDSVVKGSATTSPYSFGFDSTTVTNGTHSLTAKAYDAANNVGTSTAVNFTVSNPVGTTFNEAESNGSVAAANVVARTYTSIVGTMGNSTDKDYFAISLNANETLSLGMTGPSGKDYDLYLVDASDTTLASSTGSTSTESLTYANGATAKTVYVKVISFSGSSTTLTYTVNVAYTGGGGSSQLVTNGGFESGATSWTASSGVIDNGTTEPSHAGAYKAWLDGYGAVHTDTLYQDVAIPGTATTVTYSFWLQVVTDETTTTTAYDTLKVQVRNTSGTVLATLATYSNLDHSAGYVQRTFDLSAYKGQTVRLYFEGVEGSVTATSFLIDDVSLTAQ